MNAIHISSVVLIVPDQLRADFVGFGGATWIETPNIDRIANEGTVYSSAIFPVAHVRTRLDTESRAARELLRGRRILSQSDCDHRGSLRDLT